MIMKEILLNPGPVNISERVRKSLMRPDLCHREPEFLTLQNNIRTRLLDVYQLPASDWATVLLTGSGTAAVEAMLISMVPNDGKVLIIENGVYGERMSKIAEIHRIPCQRLHHDWGNAIDLDQLSKTLSADDFSHVAVVHHETTTGRLNNMASIASICAQKNIPLLLDGVSSFAAENLEFENWNIVACAATANKCLHGIPGVSFVIVSRDAINNVKISPRSLYLDLQAYLSQQDANGTPFTQSIQCFYALNEALDELHECGGWQQRQSLYRNYLEIIRQGLTAIGIKPLLEETDCSCVLHAFYLPEKFSYQELHDQLKARGFVIYAGQGNLQKLLFRVSAMGDISADDMHRFVNSMEDIVSNAS